MDMNKGLNELKLRLNFIAQGTDPEAKKAKNEYSNEPSLARHFGFETFKEISISNRTRRLGSIVNSIEERFDQSPFRLIEPLDPTPVFAMNMIKPSVPGDSANIFSVALVKESNIFDFANEVSSKKNSLVVATEPLNVKESCSINDILYESGSSLVYFDKLLAVLNQLFKGSSLSVQLEELSPVSLNLLLLIVEKKLPASLHGSLRAAKKVAYEEILQSLQNSAHKRSEECFKFIIAKTLVFLKRQFMGSSQVALFDEHSFYSEYFEQLASAANIPLVNFYYPKPRKQASCFSFKTSFIELLLKSEKFRKGLDEYIEGHLWESYEASINKKNSRLLSAWDKKLRKSPESFDAVINEMQVYIQKNKKCKLPWTVYEVNYAIRKVKDLYPR